VKSKAPGTQACPIINQPPWLQLEPAILYRPVGCEACNQTGYRGRTMILELMSVMDPIRPLVLRHAEASDIQAEAMRGGMQTMYAHGLRKALAGITTIEEVIRVTRDV
jgi:general secretion pathway protein E